MCTLENGFHVLIITESGGESSSALLFLCNFILISVIAFVDPGLVVGYGGNTLSAHL